MMTNVVQFKRQGFNKKLSSNNPHNSASERPNQRWIDCVLAIAQKEDTKAFQQLFDYFAPRVKHFFIKAQLDERVSEELTQETFISVWKFANYFESNKGQVSTWIFTIARNKKLDFYRKQNRQVPTLDVEQDDWAGDEQSEQYDARQFDEVKTLIKHLPEEQVTILQKVYFEELSHQKTADALNITLGTVKGRIRSAINNLSKLMRGTQ
ncbi:sigma-70 family RNA polymerase sigma factor [Pleionea sp. CnH1-48]|uniref:sigma-70 family RNA polymerase sigma factor n=1 Tax=Pleionea sp. CnH1-48 TaxID=2954494 RepID=UPI0020980CEE|nr:sigma-70 family RNA polymerase sigma factor [Pleionea sp. CnH1-48]MCO7226924.1 sigma-70 family RNA polymerase sigma factor [Pleionea sp. CnH1-48]